MELNIIQIYIYQLYYLVQVFGIKKYIQFLIAQEIYTKISQIITLHIKKNTLTSPHLVKNNFSYPVKKIVRNIIFIRIKPYDICHIKYKFFSKYVTQTRNTKILSQNYNIFICNKKKTISLEMSPSFRQVSIWLPVRP